MHRVVLFLVVWAACALVFASASVLSVSDTDSDAVLLENDVSSCATKISPSCSKEASSPLPDETELRRTGIEALLSIAGMSNVASCPDFERNLQYRSETVITEPSSAKRPRLDTEKAPSPPRNASEAEFQALDAEGQSSKTKGSEACLENAPSPQNMGEAEFQTLEAKGQSTSTKGLETCLESVPSSSQHASGTETRIEESGNRARSTKRSRSYFEGDTNSPARLSMDLDRLGKQFDIENLSARVLELAENFKENLKLFEHMAESCPSLFAPWNQSFLELLCLFAAHVDEEGILFMLKLKPLNGRVISIIKDIAKAKEVAIVRGTAQDMSSFVRVQFAQTLVKFIDTFENLEFATWEALAQIDFVDLPGAQKLFLDAIRKRSVLCAVKANDCALLIDLVEKLGSPVNWRYAFHTTLLHKAVDVSKEMMETLLRLDRTLAVAFDMYGFAPIHHAIKLGSRLEVQRLLFCAVNDCKEINPSVTWESIYAFVSANDFPATISMIEDVMTGYYEKTNGNK